MRKLVLGVVVALGLAGAARANDFVVVSSTDPAFKPGQQLMAGATVPLAAGKMLVLIHASGVVRKLSGSGKAQQLPILQASNDASHRTEVLRLMIARPRQTRALAPPVCPAPETLTDFEAILAAGEAPGCLPLAQRALQAYAASAAE